MAEIQEHTQILEAALEALEGGIAVLDGQSRVLLWNPAAAAITGYLSAEMLARPLPVGLYEVDVHHHPLPEPSPAQSIHLASWDAAPLPGFEAGRERMDALEQRAQFVHMRHSQGHVLPAMLRRLPLRDALGRRFGMMLRFHPVEHVDALPHGEMAEESSLETHVEHSQAALEDRLDEAWREWSCNGVPFGLLWINVDQAAVLRRTHGHDASEAMLGIVERTLAYALRPSEMLGRWGTHEFLVLCHERSEAMLVAHAQHVGALARTADFRWWGDRVALTVSIGAAQAGADETVGTLLKRAQSHMLASQRAGGDAVSSGVGQLNEILGSNNQAGQ